MIREVLTRAAIVLSVVWSACAWWFAYVIAPPASTFRVAWNEPWTPPAADMVTSRDLLENALRTAHSAGDVEAARIIALGIKACHSGLWDNYAAPSNPFAAELQRRGLMTDEEFMKAVPAPPPGFVLDTPACDSVLTDEQLLTSLERVERAAAEGRRIDAYSRASTFALVAGALWLLPIAAVWSIVWIFAPLSGRQA